MSYYSMLMVMNIGDDFNERLSQIQQEIPVKGLRIGGIFDKSLNKKDGTDTSFCLVSDLNLNIPNVSKKKEILRTHYLAEKGFNSGRYTLLSKEYTHPNLYVNTASTLSFDSIYNFSETNNLTNGFQDRMKINNVLREQVYSLSEWQNTFREDVYPNLNDNDLLMVVEVSESDSDSFGNGYDNLSVNRIYAQQKSTLLSSQGDDYRDSVKDAEKKSYERKKKYGR